MTTRKLTFARRLARAGFGATGGFLLLGGIASGCLSREVAGLTPNTTNVVVDQIEASAVDKIDLLFMIDNSISMADKQEILAAAVPVLAQRLVTPTCVGETDPAQTAPRDGTGDCPSGFKEEFRPIRDIHIGVVSSSLGGHGAELCSAANSGFVPEQDDRARLMGSVRNGLPSYNNLGFLFWGPDLPGGETNAAQLQQQFAQHVRAAGENGCGYEATLEAWFRFLVHPNPPAQISLVNGRTTVSGTDTDLLAQRAEFLRPDSLLAVVMLSDENDCSVNDEAGFGWLVGEPNRLPRSTEVCQSNPNDPCCRSCQSVENNGPPEGCAPLGNDPSCARGGYTDPEDDWNLRCWEQKRRYGIDLLYPVGRYVTALRDEYLCPNSPYGDMDCSCDAENARRQAAGFEPLSSGQCASQVGDSVPNPLFTDIKGEGRPVRTPDLVFLTGIVGVPWQDIATPDSLTGGGLTYLTAGQIGGYEGLTPADAPLPERWSMILGDPLANVRPSDPFMVESPDPRVGGSNPVTNDPITQPGGSPNGINGTEYTTGGGDLQYACIFPLETPETCAQGQRGCDCEAGTDNPLCNGAQQQRAKAYPGLRELHVLRDFGNNAIVASICPKVATGDTSNPAYGYTPAVNAIITRLKEVLKAKCLPRPLSVDAEGNVQCKLVESTTASSCNCTGLRAPAGSAVDKAVRQRLRSLERCGGAGQIACESLCLCEYLQPSVEQRTACQTTAAETLDPPVGPTWCYIDSDVIENVPGANASIIEGCRPSERQVLRFISSPTDAIPAKGSILTIACLGSAL